VLLQFSFRKARIKILLVHLPIAKRISMVRISQQVVNTDAIVLEIDFKILYDDTPKDQPTAGNFTGRPYVWLTAQTTK